MLGDTDRQRTVDLQPDDSADNPAFTRSPGDGELAEPAEPAEQQQQRGTVFAVFPEVLAFGRMPKVAHQFVMATWVVCAISYGPGATVPFFIATVIGYMDPSALLWLNSALCAAGILFFSLVFGSLRLAVAPGGGLELLGINEVELSAESIKSLKTWRVLLFNTFALPYVAFAVMCLALPLLMSPDTYRTLCDSIPMGEFGFLFWTWYSQPVVALGMGLMLLHSWFMTMKIGAALTAPEVQQVIDAAERGRPAASTEDWHKNVTRPALDLHELMGQLTTVWGPGVGLFTLANWLFAVGIACLFLEPKLMLAMDDMSGFPGGSWTVLCAVLMVV